LGGETVWAGEEKGNVLRSIRIGWAHLCKVELAGVENLGGRGGKGNGVFLSEATRRMK